MNHFLLILKNATGQPCETRIIEAPASTAEIAPYVFSSADQIAAYRAQLNAFHGIAAPTTAAPPKRNRVKHFQTGEIFMSAAAAARSIGVSTSAITQHLRNPARHPYVKNQTFCWIDQNGEMVK